MWSLGWSGGAWAEGDEDPFSSAAGSSTVAATAVAITSAAGSAAGSSTVTGGVTSPLAIGAGAIRQKIYHDPLETTAGGTLWTWETNLNFAPADVNTGTDVIDFGATHNMIRAEGPFRVTTDNTLPSPLTVATDYYVIRDSSTGIKLATSAQNAVAGTAINLTTQGIGTHTLVRAKSTLDGSAFLLMAALGTWALSPEAPTDNHGNTYSAVGGSPIAYLSFAASKAGCWATLGPGSNGGDAFAAGKTWSDESPPATTSSDEPSIAWLEIKGAKFVKSATQKETGIGSATITSNNVEATAAAILVGVIFGNGPVGQDHTWTWGSGFTGIPECSATGNTSDNGYIQIAVGYKIVSEGGLYSFSASGVSNEGGQMYLFAFQAQDPTGSAAGTSTVDAGASSVAAAAGAAAGVATVDGVAYVPGSPGSASGVGTAAATATAIYSSAGAAAGTSAPTATGAATAASAGAAAGTSTVAAVGAAAFAGAGAAAGTSTPTAVGAATSAAAGAAAGTSTPAGAGASTSAAAGSATGAGAASAVGRATSAASGSAAGSGGATATGAATSGAAGESAGVASATASGAATSAADGSAAGAGSATGSADAGLAVGSAAGTGAASGAGGAIVGGTGAAGGTSSAGATATAIVASSGTSSGSAAVSASGAAQSDAPGSAAGSGSAAASSTAIVAAAGAASGSSSAVAVGRDLSAVSPLPAGLAIARTTAAPVALTRTTPAISLARTTAALRLTRTT